MKKRKCCRKNDVLSVMDSIFDDFLSSLEIDFSDNNSEISSLVEQTSEVSTTVTLQELPVNLEEYLNKEEPLITLQREKYHMQMKKFSLSEVEKKLFSFVPDARDTLRDIVSSVSRKLTRPLLRAMESDSDEYAVALRSLMLTDSVSVSFIWDVPEYIVRVLRRRSSKSVSQDGSERVIGVCLKEEGYEPLIVYGMKNHSHSGTDKNCIYNHDFLCSDLADFFSMLTIHQQVNHYIQVLQTEGADNALFQEFHNKVFRYISDYTSPYYQKVFPDEKASFYQENPAEKWSLPKYVAPSIYRSPYFKRLENEGMFSLLPSVPKRKLDSVLGETGACCILSSEDVLRLPYMYIMTHPVPYNEMVYRNDVGVKWGLPSSIGSARRYYSEPGYCTLYRDLFVLIAEEKNGIKSVLDYYKDLDSGYAKSFMLKKNIPQKVVCSMRSSGFNRYFGFVEFDEDTDLKKVEEVANEFSAVWETYLTGIDSTKNVIRFRKLGQHKAAGLYYPAYGCLCVDVRHPSSLIHEYGHLIDFTHGNLSNTSTFYELRALYKCSLLSFMDSDEGFNKSMKGNSKYNLSYYLTPTEIFARCFELYVSKILGVTNSIVPQDFSCGIYPQDDAFLGKVKDYFDWLLTNSPVITSKSTNSSKAANK